MLRWNNKKRQFTANTFSTAMRYTVRGERVNATYLLLTYILHICLCDFYPNEKLRYNSEIEKCEYSTCRRIKTITSTIRNILCDQSVRIPLSRTSVYRQTSLPPELPVLLPVSLPVSLPLLWNLMVSLMHKNPQYLFVHKTTYSSETNRKQKPIESLAIRVKLVRLLVS